MSQQSPINGQSYSQRAVHKKTKSVTPLSPTSSSTVAHSHSTATATETDRPVTPVSFMPMRAAHGTPEGRKLSGASTASPAESSLADGGNVPKTDYSTESVYPRPHPKSPWYSDPREPFPPRRGQKRRRSRSKARIRQLEILYGMSVMELVEQKEALGIRLGGLLSQQEQKPRTEQETPASPGPHVRSFSARSWADIVKPTSSDPAKPQPRGRTVSAIQTQAQAPKAASSHADPASPSSTSSLSATTHSSDATELEPPAELALEDDFNECPPVLVPRGLVNTGNMCFMNSILQILLHCVPFYTFIDAMCKRLTHRFNSDTPILDSLIMFVQEFHPNVSGFGQSNTKQSPFGEPFIPEFVYDALRANTMFASMRRGHQEDAEEFLGFLLDGLHEEFLAAAPQLYKSKGGGVNGIEKPLNFVDSALADLKIEEVDGPVGDGWLEVGKKHKVAVTRTTSVAASPITKIFGGQFRSVIQTARQKPSVTLDPYQRVQLDISDPQVHTIEDALRNISQTEVISQYKSSQGETVEATKQTFFEKLPKILILHLKRFHFTVEEGSRYASVQKINKTIGYSRELQIPPDCISPQQRVLSVKYKLFGVVYHHGKSTEGGHYTVDLNYKHGNQWINFDDVSIKEIQPEDVDTVYEDESTMRRRLMSSGDWEERTAYLLFYERVA